MVLIKVRVNEIKWLMEKLDFVIQVDKVLWLHYAAVNSMRKLCSRLLYEFEN